MEATENMSAKSGTGVSMIESLKKGTSELLVLSLLNEKEMAIPQVSAAMNSRSNGRYTISGSYALFYRLERFGYIRDSGRKIAEDGRRRQFYAITPSGQDYLQLLTKQYSDVSKAIHSIMAGPKKSRSSASQD